MLWIKRNLFVAVGGLVALLLLAAGVYYFLGAKSENERLTEEIAQATNTLNRLLGAKVSPNATNIALAKAGTAQLQTALGDTRKHYTPVAVKKVTGPAFRSYRDNTLAELHRMAAAARTSVPGDNYAFSFQTQKTKVEFKEGTFPEIPTQMAEVKELCKILFAARVNPLVNIRRSRVSKDDEESGSSAANDYHTLKTETNTVTGAVISPYELTFHCLSSELASVLQGLADSPHGFVVKAIRSEPQPDLAVGPAIVDLFKPRPKSQPKPVLKKRPLPKDRPLVLLKEQRLQVSLLVWAVRALK